MVFLSIFVDDECKKYSNFFMQFLHAFVLPCSANICEESYTTVPVDGSCRFCRKLCLVSYVAIDMNMNEGI